MSKQKHVPTQVKKLRGTFRKGRDGMEMMVPAADSVAMPPEPFNEEQKKLWYVICDTLKAIGILQEIGYVSIRIYCEQYKLYQAAYKEAEDGPTIKVTSNYGTVTKPNPAHDAMGKAFNIMQIISDKFGFSPLSQSKIKAIGTINAQDAKKDKFDI